MKRTFLYSMLMVGVGLLAGCSTPSRHTKDLRLSMTPDEVIDIMGEPFTIRGAKIYDNEEWQEIWEYIPPVFSYAGFADRYDKEYWLFFENGRLVQWGEPFDFTGETTVQQKNPIIDYTPERNTD